MTRVDDVSRTTLDEATEAAAALAALCRAAGLRLDAVVARGRELHEARRRTGRAPASMRAAVDVALRVLATTGSIDDRKVEMLLDLVDDEALSPIRAHEGHGDYLVVVEQGDATSALGHLAVVARLEGTVIHHGGTTELTPGTVAVPFDGTLGEALGAMAATSYGAMLRMEREARSRRVEAADAAER